MRLAQHARRWMMVVTILSGPALAQPWVEGEAARKLLRAEKFAEAAAAYEAITQKNPFDGEAFGQYGYCLHAGKKYDEALKAYAKAIELGANPPGNLYNSACAHALLGHADIALATLEKALNARFAEQQTLENDTDWDSLRADPRFAALTGIIKGLKADPAPTREAGWAWDLDFFARRMKQMHWDLYANVSKEAFVAEVEKLKHDAASLSDTQVRARLRRIAAMVGDGHTASRLYPEGEPRKGLPVHMFAFKDGVYIIGADSAHKDLAGAKVVQVGGMKIDAALAAVRPYISVDNEMGFLAQGPTMLTSPPILQAIGATRDESGVDMVLERAGKTEKVRIEPVDFPANGHGGVLTPGFTYLHEGLKGELPLYLRSAPKPLGVEYVEAQKLVYFWFGAVTNTPEASLADTVAKVFDLIQKNNAEHLVIDMRFNGGGNTGLVPPLIQGLIKCDAVNKSGHLWVIIGRHTFSAAQNTVNLIDKNTNATFVGEPTGSRPAFVGESTYFILPHSKTRVFCSSRYWQYMDSTDQRTWVEPGIAAEPTFADYAAGRDAAMEAILKYLPTGG